MTRLTRALRYRNYRLFFAGQGISLVGTWMQQVAMSWLVYRLTGSAVYLGLLGFSNQIPSLLVTPFAGVMVDRWNRQRVVLATQLLSMLQAFVLAFLAYTGAVTIWHILPLGFFLGVVNAFDVPARQSFLADIVEKKEDFGNAVGLNSSVFNGARLVGPSIAGLVIAFGGEAACFLVNGLSYLAVIGALLAMRLPKHKAASQMPVLEGLREGVRYSFGFAPIRAILMLVALIALMGVPYMALMPVFAREILHGGPHTLGFLMGASGLGALGGAIYVASRKGVHNLGKRIPSSCFIFGLGLIAFSRSESLALSVLCTALSGFGLMIQMGSCNAFLQTVVDDDKRGRVMSLYTVAFMGVAPFGSLWIGQLAGRIGAPSTVLICGTACVLGAIFFASRLAVLKKVIHPVYVKKGLVSELA